MVSLRTNFKTILRSRHLIWGLGSAVIVGAVVCLEFYLFFESSDSESLDEPRVLVTVRDLPIDHPVSPIDLKIVSFQSEKLPKFAITDQDVSLLRGATYRRAIRAGEFLRFSDVHLSADVRGLGLSVPRGYRAFPLTPNHPLTARPGDRVDISDLSQPFDSSTRLIVSGARVLQWVNETVFVAVSAEVVSRLEQVTQAGKLSVILRNRYDTSEIGTNPAKRRPKRVPKRNPKIEVITEKG